jgi:hypothetical protein
MDSSSSRFDAWTRRQFGLAAGGLAAALLGVAPGTNTDAKKKKRKKKKPQVNAFGCLDVGKACGGNSGLCCSGICQGKKPKKGKLDKSRCVGHNVLDCPDGADTCQDAPVSCGTGGDGLCFHTTGQASFCASGGGDCFACTKDVECEADFGPGAACVGCAEFCAVTGTACQPAAA